MFAPFHLIALAIQVLGPNTLGKQIFVFDDLTA